MQRPNASPMDDVVSYDFGVVGKRARSRDYFRVVTWNIERGLQFAGILEFLRTAGADLMLLQEVDEGVRRTQYRSVASELARELGLKCVFAREFQELGAGALSTPAYHGLATLSPWPLGRGRIIRFQRQSGFWKPRWYLPRIELFQRRLGGRIALVTDALICGQRLRVYNLHLESKGKEDLRLQQLREVLEDARETPESTRVILAGDLNLVAAEGGAAERLIAAGFHDAVRLPKLATTIGNGRFSRGRSIDWIYVSGAGCSVGQVHSDVRASDHYPVSAKLQL